MSEFEDRIRTIEQLQRKIAEAKQVIKEAREEIIRLTVKGFNDYPR